jgi:hypothetical protein
MTSPHNTVTKPPQQLLRNTLNKIYALYCRELAQNVVQAQHSRHQYLIVDTVNRAEGTC